MASSPPPPPRTPSRSDPTKKPPPFTPRKRKDSTDSLNLDPTPGGDEPLGLELAPGCSLLIRGLADTRATDPRTVLQKLIDSIKEQHPDLAEIEVVIKLFKPSDANWSSSCYLHLHQSYTPTVLEGPEAEPRTDLLDLWKDALTTAAPHLEVVYTPTKTDTDKRMWIRLPDLKHFDKKECQVKVLPTITQQLEEKGIPVVSRFYSTGGPVFVLAQPSDVDKLAQTGHIILKAPHGRQSATSVKQIEIQHAYEVGIAGFPDHVEGLEKQVVDWIKLRLPGKLADYGRDLSDDSVLALSMVDWESTRQLIALHDDFLKKFAVYDATMWAPRLLFHINEEGVFKRKSARAMMGEGVEAVQELANEINMLKRNMVTIDEFTNFRREYTMDRELIQSQFQSITSAFQGMTTALADVTDRVTRSEQALVCNSQGLTFAHRLMDIKSNRSNVRMLQMMESDANKRARMDEFIRELDAEEKDLDARFKASGTNVAALLTAPVGRTLPPPPNPSPPQPAPQATAGPSQPSPARIEQEQLIPPGLSLVPQRRPSGTHAGESDREKRRKVGDRGMQVDDDDI